MNKYKFDVEVKGEIYCITVFAHNFQSARRTAIELMKQKHKEFTIMFVKTIKYDESRREYVETV